MRRLLYFCQSLPKEAAVKRSPKNTMTKEEVIAGIKEIAARMGRTPLYPEARHALKISKDRFESLCDNYTRALRECQLEPSHKNLATPMRDHFRKWAAAVRELGRIPSADEYEVHSQCCRNALRRRCRSWTNVPRVMKSYGEKNNQWEEWADVLEIIEAAEAKERQVAAMREGMSTEQRWSLPDAPSYGEPIVSPAMAHAPMNEQGVLVLFGCLAADLGYMITRVQTAFPDCEAVRRADGARWQRVRIELEFESRNFQRHGHDPAGCDLIVCWEHTWKECPVRVLELRKYVKSSR